MKTPLIIGALAILAFLLFAIFGCKEVQATEPIDSLMKNAHIYSGKVIQIDDNTYESTFWGVNGKTITVTFKVDDLVSQMEIK